MKDKVESLLNLANRIFQEEVAYITREGVEIEIYATRESQDVTAYAQGDVSQGFRKQAWTVDKTELKDEDGNYFLPKRGDSIVWDSKYYKVVEVDGVAWRNRFDLGACRILINTELQP